MATDAQSREAAPEASDLERRRSLGQFFTPCEVAAFIWEMTELLRGQPWERTSRVVDPACGEGVFLRVAIERGHDPAHCWGADIDNALVPAWQADERLRGARLFRANGLLDDPAFELLPGSFELVIGNPPFSGRGLKDLLQLLPAKGGRTGGRSRSLFGEEPEPSAGGDTASGSGSLSAADRAELDRLVRRLSPYGCWRLREESEDASNPAQGKDSAGRLFGNLAPDRAIGVFQHEQTVREIAAWPADRLLDARRPAVRNAIRRMASTAIEVFFMERFVQLAKPGGMIAVIVPESILASDQLAPLRRWLMREIQLLAVVGLPQKVFTGVGAKAKTGIIFARRYTPEAKGQGTTAKAKGNQGTSSRFREEPVIMVSPDLSFAEWSLDGYLTSIRERVIRFQADGK